MGKQGAPENIALSCSAHCGPGACSAAPVGVEHALKQAPLSGRHYNLILEFDLYLLDVSCQEGPREPLAVSFRGSSQ